MTTNRFAKLFEDEEVGQVVVMRVNDDDSNPSIQYICQPNVPGIGLCTMTLSFADTRKGRLDRDHAFERVDEAHALEAVRKVTKDTASLGLKAHDIDGEPLVNDLMDKVFELMPSEMAKHGQIGMKTSDYREKLQASFRKIMDRYGI